MVKAILSDTPLPDPRPLSKQPVIQLTGVIRILRADFQHLIPLLSRNIPCRFRRMLHQQETDQCLFEQDIEGGVVGE